MEKAKWFNHQYLQQVDDDVLAKDYFEELKQKGISASYDTVKQIVSLIKERCSFAKELWQNSDYFFVRPTEYAEKALKKRWKEGTSAVMKTISEHLHNIEDNDWAQKAEDFLMDYIQKNELNMGQIMNCLRLSVVGDTKGPNMLDIMKVLGKEEILYRLDTAIEKINL